MPPGLDNLKHIVVLMMENRSFDHMLGFLQSANYQINGLSGNELNPDANGTAVPVSKDAIFFGDLNPDPGHAHGDVMQQLFGASGPTAQPPSMSGFVANYQTKTKNVGNSHRVMKCFSAAKLPVLSTLARQFAVCDTWFSSVPGPTFPNRAFAHAATSIGRLDMSINWTGISKTIYELFDESGLSARIYYNDTSMAVTFPKLWAKMGTFFGQLQDFLDGCKSGNLPAYSFIEPRYNALDAEDLFYDASDQHPDHDVNEGEKLIRSVFTAIWQNVPLRNSTLLAIVYDEHGGLYDHLPPPATVNPDGKNWAGAPGNPDPPFDFTRLGVRVPAVLISPYIDAGGIDHTLYDHTSLIATARKLFIPNWQNTFLTQRDLKANTFEANLTRSTPRTDAITFPQAFLAAFGGAPKEQRLNKSLTEHQQALVQMAAQMEQLLPAFQRTGIDPESVQTEGDAGKYLQAVMARLRAAPPGTASAARP